MSLRRPIPPAARRILAVAFGLAFFAGPLILAGLSVYERWDILSQYGGPAEWTTAIGKALGLAAGLYLVLQAVLAARFRVLDRIFAHNELILRHRQTAIAAVVLGTLHPLVLYFHRPLVADGLTLGVDWPLLAGAALLVTLWMLTTISLYRLFLGMEYSLWWLGHRLGALSAIALFVLHRLFVTRNYEDPAALWGTAALAAAFLGVLVWRELIHPALLRKHAYAVAGIIPIGKDMHEVRLAPPPGWSLAHAPGQFAFLRFFARAARAEEHPFTIASTPYEENMLRFTIRCSGDFTARLGRLRAGDRCAVDAPYGLFSHLAHDPEGDRPLAFIAGGVGVTPFLSMLRSLAAEPSREREILLLWANRTAADIPHKDELEDFLRKLPRLTIIHVLSREEHPQPTAPGQIRLGRIDAALLKEQVEPLTRPGGKAGDPLVMLCGPPAMMEAMLEALQAAGVPRRHVVTEEFTL